VNEGRIKPDECLPGLGQSFEFLAVLGTVEWVTERTSANKIRTSLIPKGSLSEQTEEKKLVKTTDNV